MDVTDAQPVPVSKGDIPLELANKILKSDGELVVICLDVLQVPRYKIVFRSGPDIAHRSPGSVSGHLKDLKLSTAQVYPGINPMRETVEIMLSKLNCKTFKFAD